MLPCPRDGQQKGSSMWRIRAVSAHRSAFTGPKPSFRKPSTSIDVVRSLKARSLPTSACESLPFCSGVGSRATSASKNPAYRCRWARNCCLNFFEDGWSLAQQPFCILLARVEVSGSFEYCRLSERYRLMNVKWPLLRVGGDRERYTCRDLTLQLFDCGFVATCRLARFAWRVYIA